jgi:hypothetical protein
MKYYKKFLSVVTLSVFAVNFLTFTVPKAHAYLKAG